MESDLKHEKWPDIRKLTRGNDLRHWRALYNLRKLKIKYEFPRGWADAYSPIMIGSEPPGLGNRHCPVEFVSESGREDRFDVHFVALAPRDL